MKDDLRTKIAGALIDAVRDGDIDAAYPTASPHEIADVVLAEIEPDLATLRARLALLESVLAEAGEALKPFAKEAASWTAPECADEAEPHICINELFGLVPAEYTFGDLRRAASVSNQIAGMKENGK